MVNKKFNRLTILSTETIKKKNYKKMAFCLCDCGSKRTIQYWRVVSGKTKSCGCLQREMAKTHGLTKTRTYRIYRSMINRCYRKNNKDYYNYGGRGISICSSWHKSFISFLKDMGHPPSEKHSIDRINNEHGYYKENCRWVTVKEQAKNKRTNIMYTHENKTECLSYWCKQMKIKWSTVYSRLNRGWSIEKALFTRSDSKFNGHK